MNQNDEIRADFEEFARKHLRRDGPFLRMCNDIEATRTYELFEIEDAWLDWQASETRTEAKYAELVGAAKPFAIGNEGYDGHAEANKCGTGAGCCHMAAIIDSQTAKIVELEAAHEASKTWIEMHQGRWDAELEAATAWQRKANWHEKDQLFNMLTEEFPDVPIGVLDSIWTACLRLKPRAPMASEEMVSILKTYRNEIAGRMEFRQLRDTDLGCAIRTEGRERVDQADRDFIARIDALIAPGVIAATGGAKS